MNIKLLPLLLIVSIFLLSSCSENNIVCNKPYIYFASNCCLDQNDNSICDNDEKAISAENYQESKISQQTSLNFVVTKVIDGDTIELSNGDKVRLIGIDTPEQGESYYSEASKRLEELILNKNVTLERDITDKDRYGRILRYIYLENSFINLIMVKEGYAKAYPYKPDIKYQDQLTSAETEAKNKERGIWATVTTSIIQNISTEREQQTEDLSCSALGCPPGTKYVGSKNSDKFHHCSCQWAKKINYTNLNCFKSKDEAISKGYQACKVCHP